MFKRKILQNISIKKILTVYTILILAISAYVSIGLVQKDNNVDAATGWTRNASYPGCYEDHCECNNANGCDLYLHICEEWGQHSKGGKICISPNPIKVKDMANGESVSLDSILAGIDCKYVQIDVNTPGHVPYAGDLGAITLGWTDWTVCGQQPPPEQPPQQPPENPAVCPYSSTQARVQRDISDPWKPNMSVDCGTSFRVGAFHDHTGEFAGDTQLQIVGPGFNQVLSNGGVVTTAAAGTYSVYATTRVAGTSSFYPEDACKALATVVCTQDVVENPGYTLTKVATNAVGSYDIGAQVRFRIVLQNTGDTTLTTIRFRDSFDSRYLTFVSAFGTSPTVNNLNITNSLNTSVQDYMMILSNEDITTVLGDLAPGQSYSIDFTFNANRASHSTCNDVFAHPTGLTEKQARACVGIVLKTDL